MGTTSIQWTDKTWNPTRGCSRVSQGCVNCYAERQALRFSGLTLGGPAERIVKPDPFHGFVTKVNGHASWTGKVELIESMLDAPLHWKKPCRVFVNSMSDLFHEELPDEAIDRVFGIMAWCSRHTFQVLTKRSKRLMEYSQGLAALTRQQRGVRMARAKGFIVPDDTPGGMDWPLPNVWFMVSCEDQETADERIPRLLNTPAAVRGVSYEPALGPINFSRLVHRICPEDSPIRPVHGTTEEYNALRGERIHGRLGYGCKRLDWVIVGGESGPAARPFDLEWARNTIDQCRAAGVACFFKQAGARPFGITDRISSRGGSLPDGSPSGFYRHLNDRKGGDLSELPEWANVRQFPEVRS